MLSELMALLIATGTATPQAQAHNWAGYLQDTAGTCIGTIRGGQTCDSCAYLSQISRAQCPSAAAPPGCSPTCY